MNVICCLTVLFSVYAHPLLSLQVTRCLFWVFMQTSNEGNGVCRVHSVVGASLGRYHLTLTGESRWVSENRVHCLPGNRSQVPIFTLYAVRLWQVLYFAQWHPAALTFYFRLLFLALLLIIPESGTDKVAGVGSKTMLHFVSRSQLHSIDYTSLPWLRSSSQVKWCSRTFSSHAQSCPSFPPLLTKHRNRSAPKRVRLFGHAHAFSFLVSW